MSWLRRVGAFWYDFIVGDDWRLALGVVVGLAVSSLVVHVGHASIWWLRPLAVVTSLGASLRHATRQRGHRTP